MSTIVNRVATVFTASGGNVKAVMGEIAGGMQNVGRSAMDAGRNSSYMSNQMRAMATTLRYALAGSLVFGATSLVRTMSQLQTSMALMSTLSDSLTASSQKTFTTASGLRGVLDQLQQGSMDALTPVNELADSTVNLMSSLQGLDADQVTKITTTLAQGAQLAQSPVDDLTKGITGMIQAFGEAPTQRNIEGLTRGFITVTRRAPGGIAAGPQIIQQLGPSALAAQLAHVSPQQLFGLLTTVLRAGGSPSTGIRGLNFLLQQIATPASKQERETLASIGVTPKFVQKRGGVAAIGRLIQAMQAAGVTGNLSRNAPVFLAGEDQLSDVESMGVGGMTSLGVGGEGLALGQKALGRVHAVRALIALLRGSRSGNLQGDITAANNSIEGIGKEGKAISDQFADFRKAQPLRAAAIALQGLAVEIPRSLEFAMNPAARVLDKGVGIAMHHQRATRNVMRAGAGVVAALGVANVVGRVLGRGGVLTRLSGIFSPGRAVMARQAVADATNPAEAGIRGHSPQLPLYVTVVGQIFGGAVAGPQGGGGGGGAGGGIVKDAEKVAAGGGVLGLARRLIGTRIAGALGIGAGAIAAATFGAGRDQSKITPAMYGDLAHRLRKTDPRRSVMEQYARGAITHQQFERQFKAAQGQEQRLERLNRTLAPFHRRDPTYGVTQIYSERKAMVHGHAEVILDVNLTKDGKTTRKKIQVPMTLWTDGRNPSSRGQGGKVKGNMP